MNLTEELDRSFGEGPPLPPPSELLPLGRRALAKRRGVAGAAVGVAAIAVATAVLLGSQGQPDAVGPSGPAPRATDPPPATTEATEPARPRNTDEDVWPGIPDLDLVRFAEGSLLEPVEGVDLIRQVAHPELGASWAAPRDPSAAAEVRVDGARYYVLARLSDGGPPEYIAVHAADGGPTLTAFLELARERYAEGGGGLL